MNRFYVYGHYTADTNELFYIGKGTGHRAWRIDSKRANQNPYWHNKVKKHGVVVKILEDNLTEEDAFRRERELITEVGLENLTNFQPGGYGFTSQQALERAKNPNIRQKQTEAMRKKAQDPVWRENCKIAAQKRAQNPQWRKKIKEHHQRRLQNPDTVRKMQEGLQRWLKETNPSYAYNQKHYTGFISPDGTVYKDVVNLAAFCRTHGLNRTHMHYLYKGKYTQHKGWTKYIPENTL